jgi:hypothetical protein
VVQRNIHTARKTPLLHTLHLFGIAFPDFLHRLVCGTRKADQGAFP